MNGSKKLFKIVCLTISHKILNSNTFQNLPELLKNLSSNRRAFKTCSNKPLCGIIIDSSLKIQNQSTQYVCNENKLLKSSIPQRDQIRGARLNPILSPPRSRRQAAPLGGPYTVQCSALAPRELLFSPSREPESRGSSSTFNSILFCFCSPLQHIISKPPPSQPPKLFIGKKISHCEYL